MLKKLLIHCCELLNRNDISTELKTNNTVADIFDNTIQNDILRLISFYNYTTSLIFNNYIKLINTEVVTTDKFGNIYFDKFIYTPVEIAGLKNKNKQIQYTIYPSHINTTLCNTPLIVSYQYIPKSINKLCDKLFTNDINILNAISYGVVSEFLASKNLFNESDFWKNKFMNKLFELKSNKNRYIKTRFTI